MFLYVEPKNSILVCLSLPLTLLGCLKIPSKGSHIFSCKFGCIEKKFQLNPYEKSIKQATIKIQNQTYHHEDPFFPLKCATKNSLPPSIPVSQTFIELTNVKNMQRETHIDRAFLSHVGPILSSHTSLPIKVNCDCCLRLVISCPKASHVVPGLRCLESKLSRWHMVRIMIAIPVL